MHFCSALDERDVVIAWLAQGVVVADAAPAGEGLSIMAVGGVDDILSTELIDSWQGSGPNFSKFSAYMAHSRRRITIL